MRSVAASIVTLALAASSAIAAPDPYHDPAVLNARLKALHDANPKQTRLVTLATTKKGDVVALEVDPSGKFDKDAPILLVQGGVHGSEWISTEVALRMAELVAAPKQQEWNGLVYRFIPAVNIEGLAQGSRTMTGPDGRQFDPNRDWPVPEQADRKSRPVIQAVRDYTLKGRTVGVLDYHSNAECMLWPWAYTAGKTPPDIDALRDVAREMAMSVGYCDGQVARVIRYKHQGTAADWYQHALRAPTLLVELAGVDDPGNQTTEQILIDQERPFRIFVRWLVKRAATSAHRKP